MSLAVLEPEETAIAEPDDARWAPPVSYYDPAFKAYVAELITRLLSLKAGWDGYRAPAIRPEIVEVAAAFVSRIPDHIAPRPRVVPLSSGSLQLEWVAGAKVLEFEFETASTIHYLKWNPATQTSEEDSFEVDDLARAEALIKWFTRRDVP